MKIVFLIHSLYPGGAERQLVDLAVSLKDRGHGISVCVFYSGGDLESELQKNGILLYSLEKKNHWNILSSSVALIRFLRKKGPDIIYSYMGTANVFSILLKPFLANFRVVWGVRASNMDSSQYNRVWKFAYFLERKLSRFADLIIANSFAGLSFAVKNGFKKEKMIVVHNGINTKKFKQQPQLRQIIRKEWNINNDEILIGHVARLDPKKDHLNFIKAASKVAAVRKNVQFICIGRGADADVDRLMNTVSMHGLKGRFLWAGPRNDMPAAYNGLDILCMSSAFGEGFPNVIGEAMACGLPCVSTDVGDSAIIIGNTGITVPPEKPDELAEGLLEMISRLENKKENIYMQVRHRIVHKFKTAIMVSNSESALTTLLQ